MRTQPIDYKFRIMSEDDFEIELDMFTNNRAFKRMFSKMAGPLGRRINRDIDPNMDLSFVERIEVAKRTYPTIKNYIGKIIKDIERDCMRIEKVQFIDWVIHEVVCNKKKDGNWIINVLIRGNYSHLAT